MTPLMHTIEFVKSLGYRVFVPETPSTYAFYSDKEGTKVGYFQCGERGGVTTVHLPNTRTGAGFHAGDEISHQNLVYGLMRNPPGFENGEATPYKSLESFLQAHWQPLQEI